MMMLNKPICHLSKRESISKSKVYLVRIMAFGLALVIGAFIFMMMDADPLKAYSTIINSALFKKTGIRQVLKNTIPLLTVSLALIPCFKMKFWNIGAEGQITMGAIFSSFLALNYASNLSSIPLLILMGIFSMIGGMLWALIPAFFKAKYNTNETLFTLLMNYIAIGIVSYLQGGPWEGKPGSQIIPMFEDNAVLPKLFGVQCGWVIALIMVFFIYIYMNYTKYGYQLEVLSESENTAKYAGMNIFKLTMSTVGMSGAICGLAGFIISSGTHMTLYTDVAGGIGFTAISVCWLSQLNPFIVVLISFLLSVLSKGAASLQTSMAIPSSISDIITGIIFICLLACEFFINYKVIFNKTKEAKHGF